MNLHTLTISYEFILNITDIYVTVEKKSTFIRSLYITGER